MLSNTELKLFHKRLLELKTISSTQIENLSSATRINERDSVGSLSSYDNHPADMGTELEEREKDRALLDFERQEVHEIDLALNAIDSGTYGVCQVCHEDIPIERLDAIPSTLYCIEHSPKQELRDIRVVNEDILGVPFITNQNTTHQRNYYDSEDAYQDVAMFGSSDTPSDLGGDIDHYIDAFSDSDELVGSVEALEDFIGTDIYGENVKIYPNQTLEKYEKELDEYDESMYGEFIEED